MTVTMARPTYPVHVGARLDPDLSRWQWLVKWLLLVPHYLVLALLWPAFLVLSVVAFFAILLTGRYPRVLFDFNVGVLRWTWRVSYYAYGALGTDRYPPFSLREAPDYPAHLEVDYPEHLSRGLALVKWWLLALPHYLVVGLLVGGVGYVAGGARQGDPWTGPWASGLIGLLTLVAAVTLLVTGRYPPSLFDLVLGLNRWVLRVAAYVALMTDRYPPFRLDQGGEEGSVSTLPPPVSPAAPGTRPPATGWTTGRVVAAVLGSLLLLGSAAVGLSGVAVAVADRTLRDDAGFLMTAGRDLSTDRHALTSESMQVHLDGVDQFVPDELLGDVRLTADPRGDSPVFIGIAPTADVDRYLSGVGRATVTDVGGRVYDVTDGAAPAAPPTAQRFWVARDAGTATQHLTWNLAEGDWTIVAMNADGSAGIDVSVAAGATLPALGWFAAALLSLGGVGLVVGAVTLTSAVRAAART